MPDVQLHRADGIARIAVVWTRGGAKHRLHEVVPELLISACGEIQNCFCPSDTASSPASIFAKAAESMCSASGNPSLTLARHKCDREVESQCQKVMEKFGGEV